MHVTMRIVCTRPRSPPWVSHDIISIFAPPRNNPGDATGRTCEWRNVVNVNWAVCCVWLQSLPSSYHVVVVDLPGHGDSSIPAATDDVSMSLMLDALREVIYSRTNLLVYFCLLCVFCFFLPHDEVKRGICCERVCPSVCLSACLSHSWGMPEWFKISKYFLHHTIEEFFKFCGQISSSPVGSVHRQRMR